jgi:uroporphyrinogen III methyltransferase/synthase
MKVGKVYLVGAGPGDPGLLTLRAKDLLSKADVVLYDALIPPRVLGFIPHTAEKIFRGHRHEKGALSQEALNALMVKKAKQGKNVVRLKGGDPFVFGRGAEEAMALREEGIPFEIVPGVSSSVAVPAYAGIPVTHRTLNSCFTVVTGHEDPTKENALLDWKNLAQNDGTLVFLMGLHTLTKVCKKLMAEGKDPKTLVAVIQSGTTSQQRTVTGDLLNIGIRVQRAGLTPPATVVVGKVVGLMDILGWLKFKPLSNLRVLVTRTRSQASFVTQLLEDQGAEVVEIPTIEISPLPLKAEGKKNLKELERYDWLIFTSANAVEIFIGHLLSQRMDSRHLSRLKIACVGEATAKALKKFGLKADMVPNDYKQEGLVKSFQKTPLKGTKTLLARAKEGRELLEGSLRKQGALVKTWALYENRVPQGAKERLKTLFEKEGGVDLFLFASSSAADHLYGLMTPTHKRKCLKSIPTAVIGPITGATVKKWGAKIAVEPKTYTLTALVEAVVRWNKKRKETSKPKAIGTTKAPRAPRKAKQ